MNAIVIEHVPVAELPLAWRAKFAKSTDALVTVCIEEEAGSTAPAAEEFMTNDPLFGMWRDREDMADVAGYVRSIRASRFSDDGSTAQLMDTGLTVPMLIDSDVLVWLTR